MDWNFGEFPLYSGQSGRREIRRCRLFPLAEKWLHAIPLTVFLCFSVLWLFSHPVNVVIEDGRIVAIHEMEKLLALNNTHVEFAILASDTYLVASVPQKLTRYNETESYKLNKTD